MLLSRCVRACVCVCACMFACLCVCVCVMVRCCHYDGRGGGGRLSTSLGSGTCTHTAFLDVAHPCMAHLIGSQALSHAQLTPHSAAVGPSQCMAHVSSCGCVSQALIQLLPPLFTEMTGVRRPACLCQPPGTNWWQQGSSSTSSRHLRTCQMPGPCASILPVSGCGGEKGQ